MNTLVTTNHSLYEKLIAGPEELSNTTEITNVYISRTIMGEMKPYDEHKTKLKVIVKMKINC